MKKHGFWKIKETRIVYQNPWISVREDAVVRPDGKSGIFGVVTMVPGVSVIPVDKKGNVFLTKEFHYGVGRVTIEAISGGIDKKETRSQAARRELKEETGLVARKWKYLGFVDPFTTVVVSPNHMYLAQDLRRGKSEQEGTESIKVMKIPFRRALQMVNTGEITHSATCVALLKAREVL